MNTMQKQAAPPEKTDTKKDRSQSDATAVSVKKGLLKARHPCLKTARLSYLLLWRFFLSFFLRLCVAIFARFLFFPQGTAELLSINRFFHYD
ncbi:MAG: hypothetical protein J6K96_09100 [Treponema sp.]|nr:hypothetical protein [Treponema sp.]